MKVVAMIPIKLNNQRLPGKNIKCFDDGTPLVHCIQRALLEANSIDEIYVYCSNISIQDYLLPGVKFLNRSFELDADSINCNDILDRFIKEVDADIYIASHATGPFTSSRSINKCVNAVQSEEYDSAFIATKMQQFLWQEGKALNFDIQNFPRTQDLVPIYVETPGAYVFKKEVFEKYKRRVGIKPYICEGEKLEEIDIDNPEDFKIANAIYMNIIKNRDEKHGKY
ncbi:hypothetical protein [Clostridium sp. AM58-1XD]|uniref:acylneuraminate cytidylyltransferase family protein n=1 Tax=Clostridium sp. AM58-1XD TaxID=2292307 RepID=UPI000E4FD670|nr:hypothetical protein [Clostridium sp. AM58-1XD]RGY94747.1 hypothetical protein DXA13_20370 [Clostridium sp. AM58-1XD]